MSIFAVAGYFLAYLLTGTFFHWLFVRVDGAWEDVNYEVARKLGDEGLDGKFLFAFVGFLVIPGHLVYTALVVLKVLVKYVKKRHNINVLDPFAWFDAALEQIKALSGLN